MLIIKDKAGLEMAKQLKELMDATVEASQAGDLPDHLPSAPTATVNNPFKS
jgi:hypothetical protein